MRHEGPSDEPPVGSEYGRRTNYSIASPNPWLCYNPSLPYHDYQHPTYDLPRSHDLYDQPLFPYQDFW